MTIYGYTPTAAQFAAVIVRMQQGTFTATNLCRVAVDADVPIKVGWKDIAYRFVDRLIQQQRKAGNIKQVKSGLWEWVKR